MAALWKAAAGLALIVAGLTGPGAAAAARGPAGTAGPSTGGPVTGPGQGLPAHEAPVCGAPAAGRAMCHAIQLLQPSRYWHPGPAGKGPGHGGGGGGAVPAPPTSGYYPGDLQSAYGLSSAVSGVTPGPTAPTIAIVDAYDDPNAASDLAAYRASLSGAIDLATGLSDATIPPLCSSAGQTGCVTFTKVNQAGGTTYPSGNTGWAEEISLDLDMVSAICPGCNIVLVEASSNSFTNLVQAVTEAKTFTPAAITNSYGGGEFSTETSYNGVFSGGTSTAMTAATGDGGYGVEFPASSSGLTAVGGTSLTYSGTGTSLTWAPQTVWSGAGSGCSAYEPMPAWQNDSGVYSLAGDCTTRQVADVSAVANPNTGVATYDTYNESGWLVFGGTSVSTQIIGAVYGLAAGNGSLRPSPSGLYVDSGSTTGPTPGLAPVTSGSNAGCGDYLCNAADSLSSGYNGPTGLGTPDGVAAFSGTTATSGSLSFSPTSETLTAGSPSGALFVDLSTKAPSGGLTVSLTTSSAGGTFSTSSTGPFGTGLSLTIPDGATAGGPFYYEDTIAGSSTVTASAAGWGSGTLPVTVSTGPLASITVSPGSASVAEGGSQLFTATGFDGYGNEVVSGFDPSWSTTVSGGSVSQGPATTTTFTAGSGSGSGSVVATQDGVSGTASVTVVALASMSVAVSAGRIVKRGPNYKVPLTVTATAANSTTAISGASVRLQVYAGSCPGSSLVSTGTGTTGSTGQVGFTFTTRTKGSWCAAATVTASGYAQGTGQATFTT